MRHWAAALLIAIALTTDVAGQQQPPAPSAPYRNPAAAGVFSFVIPGAGQAYNGQWGKGLGVLASTVGLVALGSSAQDRADQEFAACRPTTRTPCEEVSSYTLFYIAGAGAWLFGILDAAFTADHLNNAARAKVEAGATADGRVGLAFRIATP